MKHVVPLGLLELEPGNFHITVESLFDNGQTGLWVIDTGASKTVFDQALSDFYEPAGEEPDVFIQSAGIGAGRLDTTLGKMRAFSMASLTIQPIQVALIDLSHINTLYFHITEREICGLIGSDFLLKNKAVIDYSKMELTLDYDG